MSITIIPYASPWKALYPLELKSYDKRLAGLALQIVILSWLQQQQCQIAQADSNVWQYLDLSLLMEQLELTFIWHPTK